MADLPVSGLFDLDQMKTPDNTDVLLAFHLDSSGRPIENESGYYSVALLIQTLGKVATDAEAGAISAKEAVEEMKTAVEQTIAAFNTKVTQDNSAWDNKVSTDKSSWQAQVAADLQSLSTALSNALSAIGESNSAGARGAAIEAVNEALQNALASIGTSDTTGARGEAITAIENALNTALTTWASQVSEDNTAFDSKVAQANTTIDQKVTTATTKATEASNSAALAKKWAENPEDEPVEGTGDNAEYSSKHWAKKAEANSQVPMATDTTAGKVYLSDTVEIGENEANLDKKVVNKQALHDALEDLRNDMKQTLPSPEVEYVKAATGDYGTFTLKTNYSSAFGSVKVVMTPSSADPSASDTEITVGGTTVSANDNWQITAIQTDPDAMYSDSLTSVIEVTDLKVQTPVINYDDSTYTITLQCATTGAVIHYTIDGSSVSASSPVYNGAISITESVTIQVLAVKDGIQNSNTVSKVCNVTRILCTSFPIEGHDGTRLTPSTDPLHLVTETITQEPVPEIPGTQSGSSPYDQYTPWQKKRRNFVNGSPEAWDGDLGFSTTEKDTMVYYPDCYIKFVVSSDVEYFYISDKPYDGFEQAKWAEKYKAAYETSNSNESKSGKSVQVNQSITTMRTNANNKGTGWGILDAVMHSADQWLFMVEYASRDAQEKIGQGISSVSSKHSTGETDVLTYHTGRCSGTDAASAVRYRWSENLWGNVYEWCDGVRIFDTYQKYVTDNPELYDSPDHTGWIPVGEVKDVSNNYILSFEHSSEASWCCFIPAANTTDINNCAAPDYTYMTTTNRFLYVSGYWNGGSYCGLFYFYLGSSASSSNSNIGSRLTYRKAA